MSLVGSFPTARRRRAVLVVLVTLGLVAFAPGSASAASTQTKLNGVAGRIARLQTQLAHTEARLARLRAGVTAAQRTLNGARSGIVALTRGMYISGLDGTSAMFTAETVTEFGDRVAFIEHLRAADRDTIERVAVARTMLERRQAGLSKVVGRQRALLRSLGAERMSLSKLFRQEQDRLRALDSANRKRRGRVRASRFDPPIVGRGPFQVCPVDRPRAYSNDFGAPRAGHRHQGNDIIAPRGTPIRAPFPGRFYRNSSGSGGLQARVFGAQGYVFNGHLDSYASLANNSQVAAGTIIGYVGDSGNARGGVTHNHFEWHPGGGRAVNPYRYLNLVC